MTISLRKIFILAGPTASGKTQLAAHVARRTGAEILGADAIQVFKGLDILAAKPSTTLCKQIPHHLIDTFSPREEINVARYLDKANRAIAEIESRDRVVLIVGGSGFYLHALLEGMNALPSKQYAHRNTLESYQESSLYRMLRALHAEHSEIIDRDNKRRLTRALELLMVGTSLSNHSSQELPVRVGGVPKFQSLGGVLLGWERTPLRHRIKKRIEAMFQEGVIEEFYKLPQKNEYQATKPIGYTEIQGLIAGTFGLKQCKELLFHATCQYAKRQAVWFNKYSSLPTVEICDENGLNRLGETIVQKIIDRSKQFA